MSLDNVFDIAGSGMSAQSLRLNTTASNIANAQTASSSTGDTYRARHPIFSAIQQDAMRGAAGSGDNSEDGVGVQVAGIVESQAPLEKRYEPGHPQADENGYVYYPNVDIVEEMANMISASRSFQMNADVMNSAKTMIQRVLTIGQ